MIFAVIGQASSAAGGDGYAASGLFLLPRELLCFAHRHLLLLATAIEAVPQHHFAFQLSKTLTKLGVLNHFFRFTVPLLRLQTLRASAAQGIK